MAGRDRTPRVAPLTGKARLVELGKDILIVALSCSALVLAGKTPLVSDLKDVLGPAPVVQHDLRPQREAAEPYLTAVRGQRGLYGAAYDPIQVQRAFRVLSPYVGEALSTAGPPEDLTERRWRALMEVESAYFAFQGKLPLSLLSAWLGEGGGPQGEAQSLLLAWDGGTVWLCWREGGAFRGARTQVVWEDHLQTALEEFNPNGAAFAYTLVDRDETYATLDPYVLVSMAAPRPPLYSATAPDFTGDPEALARLLGQLGFQSGGGAAYEPSEGWLAITEGSDRLRVSRWGGVVYHAGEEGRYPVAVQGEAPTAAEAAGAAWDLLNRAAEGWKGAGDFVLTAVTPTEGGWTVDFHSRLRGVPVLAGETGWAARFTVRGREVRDFTLTLRTYADTGSLCAVPSERLAAAALNSLHDLDGRLVLCYSDTGADTTAAGWVAETP